MPSSADAGARASSHAARRRHDDAVATMALLRATRFFPTASRLALPEKWEALAKEVQRIAEGGENGLEMRPL